MAITINSHQNFMADLARALSLDPHCVNKIVIEAEANSIVKVYVKGYLDNGHVPGVIGTIKAMAVSDVRIADDCTVIATPILSSENDEYRCEKCHCLFSGLTVDACRKCPRCKSEFVCKSK